MLMIRLQRVGRKKIPIFRIVLTDKRNSTKSGRYLELLGNYDPRKGGIKQVNGEKIKHWLSKGAKATGTIHNLLISEKIITGKKVNVLPKKTPPKKEEKLAEAVVEKKADAPIEALAEPAPAEATKA